MNDIPRTTHEIDATGQAVGRVATQVVTFLRGKHKPTFEPRNDEGDAVVIVNAGKVIFTGKKRQQKDYRKHSMYPGGLKTTPMKRVFDTDPTLVLRRAIDGMLPKTKHKTALLKRLTIKA